MTKTPQEEYQENLALVSFLGAVKGSLNEIDSKIIDGRIRPESLDIKKVALEHDLSKGINPISHAQQQQAVQPSHQPVLQTVTVAAPNVNDDQLLLPFDKKYDLNEIFQKIDDVYRKVISLESEVFKLREALDNKKKDI